MKICFVVNTHRTDESGQTTYRVAAECARRGHEVFIASSGRFSYDADEKVRVFSRSAPHRKYASSDQYLTALKGKHAVGKWINLYELDVLMLRSNPSVQTAWAQYTGIHFGRLAARAGVIVLNDPDGLSRAMNKLYLQGFPEDVRPRSLITRDKARIRKFAKAEGTIVLKPLQGSGGRSVFVLRPENSDNLDEIVRAVSRDGYMIAQEYLPAAEAGDTRLFLMNGVPLKHKGHIAAFRRIRTGHDIRSNIHAGGRLRRANLTEKDFELADKVRSKLKADGMFLVGLDIVGSKLMEINVFVPGGLGSAKLFEKVDFSEAVADALEKKVAYKKSSKQPLDNLALSVF